MEERGGEEEGAAQGRTRPGRPGAGAATAVGEGCARAREHGTRAPPPGREKGAPSRRGNRGGRGAATGEGEGRVGEALHGWENEETKKP